jgi:hypothetical protein
LNYRFKHKDTTDASFVRCWQVRVSPNAYFWFYCACSEEDSHAIDTWSKRKEDIAMEESNDKLRAK